MEGSKLNKSQSKYYHTACLMDEALIALLEKKNYEFITVKEICEKAGVNRSTFYLHYEAIEDLLSECIEYVGKKISLKFNNNETIDKNRIDTCPIEELILITPEYLIPYLQFVKENKQVFMAAVLQPSALRTQEISKRLYCDFFEPILKRFHIPENERQYKITFYLSGLGSVIIEWIKHGCREEIEEITNILISCLNISS